MVGKRAPRELTFLGRNNGNERIGFRQAWKGIVVEPVGANLGQAQQQW